MNVEPCKAVKEGRTKPRKKKNYIADKIDADLIDSDEDETTTDALEDIADTGRLFVRNLSYLCTETDMKELFEQYGTLTELILPIDDTTERPKGTSCAFDPENTYQFYRFCLYRISIT